MDVGNDQGFRIVSVAVATRPVDCTDLPQWTLWTQKSCYFGTANVGLDLVDHVHWYCLSWAWKDYQFD